MPAVFLDRLPLPNLQAYTAISVALLSCSFYYAIQITSSEEWKLNSTLNLGLVPDDVEHLQGNQSGILDAPIDTMILEYPVFMRALEIVNFMVQEPLCIWTLINMAYCCLILIGKVIQKLVFGDLRVSEQQHIKDKFWNFVFYKFIFIFGVMNVQFMDEVLLWCSWFTVLGFLHLLAQLSKDRFEYLSFSPTTPKLTHVRLLALLSGIMLMSSSLFIICVVVGLNAGINTFAFMAAECSLVTVRTLYVIVRYAIHLWDVSHEGVWELRATYVYYTELFFELVALATDFLHHLHMLLWGNIFLSMASLVICMQLRYLFYEIQRRVHKHKNYLRVIRHMETNYSMATAEELDENSDDCAICWDRMEAARKLPCGHLFHNSCLRSWLEQDTSCPTCRMTLNGAGSEGQGNAQGMGQGPSRPGEFLAALGHQDPGPQLHPANQTTNHFFHFDGSRYVSWLPSFSVEVTHTTILGERQVPAQSSQLDTMARQVQQMFPNMPINMITDDLRITRSVDLTVENILDERLIPPPVNPMFHNTYQTPDMESHSQETSEPLVEDQVNKEMNKVAMVTQLLTSEAEESESSTQRKRSQLMPVLGSRFSKSPKEREDMLSQRKEDLLKVARKKYLSKKEASEETSSEQS